MKIGYRGRTLLCRGGHYREGQDKKGTAKESTEKDRTKNLRGTIAVDLETKSRHINLLQLGGRGLYTSIHKYPQEFPLGFTKRRTKKITHTLIARYVL